MFTVIVVDDDIDARDALVGLLEDEGMRAIGTTRGVKALRLLGSVRTHLVIADLQMPEMDGATLVRELRATDHGETLPVLLLSGGERPSDLDALTTFMHKPPDIARFLSTIRGLLAAGSAARGGEPE